MRPKISDEAVEAAAKAILKTVRPGIPNWEEWTDEMFKLQALAVLEDVAPYLMAKSWDEGHRVGFRYGIKPNPYSP